LPHQAGSHLGRSHLNVEAHDSDSEDDDSDDEKRKAHAKAQEDEDAKGKKKSRLFLPRVIDLYVSSLMIDHLFFVSFFSYIFFF